MVKTSEIVNAHVQQIIELLTVYGTNLKKIYDFNEKVVCNVQVRDTIKRLREINGYVRINVDKIPKVRLSLVMLKISWKDWTFGDLVNALKLWTERNPLIFTTTLLNKNQSDHRNNKMLHTDSQRWKQQQCVYCNSTQVSSM